MVSLQKVPSGNVTLKVRMPASGSKKQGVYTTTELLLSLFACDAKRDLEFCLGSVDVTQEQPVLNV